MKSVNYHYKGGAMKNLFIFFIFFLFINVSTIAQQGWIEQTSGTSSSLYSVNFINENIGWISGEDGVIKKTTDGGQSWNNTSFHGSQTARWYCIRFVNNDEGYAAGSVYIVDRWMSNWALTTNGGNSWEWQTSWGSIASSTRDVYFLDENIGWEVGPSGGFGKIDKTTTGVTGFSNLTSLSETIYSVWFVDASDGWCVGSNGSIYITFNGGNSWYSQNSGTTKSLKSVCFINSSVGWAVGYGGGQAVILKTTDAGQSWEGNLPTSIMTLNSIYFTDEDTGWACGKMDSTPNKKAVILYTNDGGINWEVQHANDNHAEYYAIYFINDAVGWAVGTGGSIVKTTTGGVTAIENDNKSIPTDFSISQNYPNPFNPNTKIKYQIPELSFVTLKVYDVLGNEIMTLVNGEESAGKYKVEFDATGLPSGVYFYSLQTGDFINTRKMIILR